MVKIDFSLSPNYFLLDQVVGRESGKAQLVLEQLHKKWRESSSSTEDRLLGDKLAAMETKCEQLEEKLADARSEVNSSIIL